MSAFSLPLAPGWRRRSSIKNCASVVWSASIGGSASSLGWRSARNDAPALSGGAVQRLKLRQAEVRRTDPPGARRLQRVVGIAERIEHEIGGAEILLRRPLRRRGDGEESRRLRRQHA